MQSQELRNQAQDLHAEARESFERCDTDGFVSQWADGINARRHELAADLADQNNESTFVGLYEGDRRVRAKKISTRYGLAWLLHDSETDLIERRGKPFLPEGDNSRVLKQLGLEQRGEIDAARAEIVGGSGKGLSGAATCHVSAVRDGDEWGATARLATDEESEPESYTFLATVQPSGVLAFEAAIDMRTVKAVHLTFADGGGFWIPSAALRWVGDIEEGDHYEIESWFKFEQSKLDTLLPHSRFLEGGGGRLPPLDEAHRDQGGVNVSDAEIRRLVQEQRGDG